MAIEVANLTDYLALGQSEEYADAGLLGTPDTGFSSTGARIYSDGTIRGKSSYGSYVKRPNGVMECKGVVSVGATTGSSYPFITSEATWTFPYAFVGTIPSCSGGSNSSLVVTNTSCTSLAESKVRCYLTASSGASRSVYVSAVGEY